ncbi:hypothetical protein Sru01_07150 [Sphaerisporangium rufum]|uniref:DUF262 domain-containing protein n=1 Tax=Sphaerisporangium rufum TaxID=1381558 RepID=A0A919UZM1_9ACTN|nr:DUF262 domain-containing protein [Sphaerisporangium rufum]GII75733.1 hypothetical protein Sru01_07150 [Sphaerisporangium rufum]
MKANETTLRAIIAGQQQLLVPLYQRPYSWERGQLATLWRDIELQADRVEQGKDNSHFLGSVVLAPGPNNSPGNPEWLVVDGQQRLTTLLVALCALRDHQAAEDPIHRDRINETHLINRFLPGEARYRLLPTQVDRQAYKDCVEGQPFGTTDSLIAPAYQFFRTKLVEVDDPADPHDIARIESVVLNRLNLVQIVVEGDDNTFRIFESINNTGMRLSQVDLIRNYVFMHLPTKGQFVYDTYWLPMQQMLGPKGMDQLMYLALVLERGDEAQYNDTYRGHQDLLREVTADKKDVETKVEQYVKDLARRSRYLQRILEPTGESELDERLRFLNEWKGNTAYPVILRLLELRESGEACDERVIQAQRYIESFLVRRLIAGVTTGSLNKIFMRLTRELTGEEDVDEVVRRGLSPARLYWSSDEQFRSDIRNRSFYWQGRTAQQKLVLRRLEESYGGKEHVEVADKKITIEHVLPQTLTAEWRAQLAADGDADRIHKELVHTLGNLTLTGYNSELSNTPFPRKRDFLGQSSLVMNQRIAKQERWGRAEIQARADELAARAIEIWPSPLDLGPVGPSRDWTLLHSALAALPTGTWTTYGDLAELIGSHAVPVGVHLSASNVLNAHRVLTSNGQVSKGFHWADEDDDRDVHEVLRAEGIRLDEAGRADPGQRISARELAELLELPGAVDLSEAALTADEDYLDIGEQEQRFLHQLGEARGPHTVGKVSRLLAWWRGRGGEVQFGRSANVSCAPFVKVEGGILPIVRFYAKVVEVPFATHKKRVPFTDPLLRDELRRRLNEAPGVDLPAAKLELYPSFDIALMANDAVWDVVVASLDWFASRVQAPADPE